MTDGCQYTEPNYLIKAISIYTTMYNRYDHQHNVFNDVDDAIGHLSKFLNCNRICSLGENESEIILNEFALIMNTEHIERMK
jgi:hypothetical protein